MKKGESRIVFGISLECLERENLFCINEEEMNLETAISYIQTNTEGEVWKGINYLETAFILKDGIKIVGAYRIRNRKQHRELLEIAKRGSKKSGPYYLYTSALIKEGKKYYATGIHIIDWESVENAEEITKNTKKVKPSSTQKKDPDEVIQEAYQKLLKATDGIDSEEIKKIVMPPLTTLPAFTLRMKAFLEKEGKYKLSRSGNRKATKYSLLPI